MPKDESCAQLFGGIAAHADELIDFAEGGAGSSGTKAKIRNAFASLSMKVETGYAETRRARREAKSQ